jgi:hypothetical protein
MSNKPSAITQWQKGEKSYGSTDAKIYVTSNVNDLLDAYFDKHGILNFDFKSAVWSKLCRFAQKIVADELEKLLLAKFPKDTHPDLVIEKIRFSHKCGCSCGCSPGYHIELTKWVAGVSCFEGWADVYVDELTLNRIKCLMVSLMGDIHIEKMKSAKEYVRKAMKEMRN